MRRILTILGMLALTGPAQAEGEAAGDFDYYVMALSWSAGWCALEGDARRDPQCDAGRGLTFVLHGLWPQYEIGWPSYCRTVERDPTRGQTAAMADVMGGSGLAFYEWKKHGRCSGLSADEYFQTSRQAFEAVVLPPVFAQITSQQVLPASVVEAAFLETNPAMTRDQITIICSNGLIQEVRLCLTPDLQLRRCGADAIRDCSLSDAVLEPVR